MVDSQTKIVTIGDSIEGICCAHSSRDAREKHRTKSVKPTNMILGNAEVNTELNNQYHRNAYFLKLNREYIGSTRVRHPKWMKTYAEPIQWKSIGTMR